MITENGFGIMGFFLKGVLGDKKLLFCNVKTLTQLIEKENLFKPNRKSYEVKSALVLLKKTSKSV